MHLGVNKYAEEKRKSINVKKNDMKKKLLFVVTCYQKIFIH